MAERTAWFKLCEAADEARCGQKLLRREIKAGRLRAARIGGRRDIRIHRDWISEWLIAASTPIVIGPRRAS